MIVIRAEVHSARTGEIREVGRIHISNTGPAKPAKRLASWKRCDYRVELMRRGTTTKVVRSGLVRDYPRMAYTVWELVRRALECTLGKWPVHPGRPEEFDEEVLQQLEDGPSFEQVWAGLEAQGYQYGPEALEQVRFGWELAHGVKS